MPMTTLSINLQEIWIKNDLKLDFKFLHKLFHENYMGLNPQNNFEW